MILMVPYAGLSFFMSSIIDEDAFIYFRCPENILEEMDTSWYPGGENMLKPAVQ